MTALAMPGDREKFLAQGMDGYVSKPINREELYDCISILLNGNNSTAANTDSAGDTEPGEAETAVIDKKIFDALLQNVGADLLPQIIDTFLSEMSGQVKAITAAAERGDCKLVAAEAHSLKSSSAYFGAMALAELARQLERSAHEHDLNRIRKKVSHLSQLSERTGSELLGARSNMPSPAPE